MNIWSQLGFSVAFVAAFCAALLKGFQHQSFYATYKWYLCGGLAAAGVILTLLGNAMNTARRRRYLESQTNDSEEQDTSEPTGDPGQPFFLANVAYWGLILLAFGATTALITPIPPKPQPVHARQTPPPLLTNPPAAATATATPELPTNAPLIKLQGLVFREPNSSVLINGRTYFIGDTVDKAQLIEIQPTSAVFQWEGKRLVVNAPQ